MLLHGNYIYKTGNEEDLGVFLFWAEKGSTLYRRRGRTPKNALPLYPELVNPDEILKILTHGKDNKRANKNAHSINENIKAGNTREENIKEDNINENNIYKNNVREKDDKTVSAKNISAGIFKLESDRQDDSRDSSQEGSRESSPENSQDGSRDDSNEITPYEIKGIAYSQWETLSILLSIEDIASQEPELELAPEIIYWVQSAKFAAELIVKHRYYPDMKINERSSLYSYWRMLADKSEDNERFSILREGMPPSCRAVFH